MRALLTSTFGNTPRMGAEVVDIYAVDALQGYLEDPLISEGFNVLQDMFPNFSPSKILALLKDNPLINFLKKIGETLDKFIDKILALLPDGSWLEGLLEKFGLMTIWNYAKRIWKLFNKSKFKEMAMDRFFLLFDNVNYFTKYLDRDGDYDNYMGRMDIAGSSGMGQIPEYMYDPAVRAAMNVTDATMDLRMGGSDAIKYVKRDKEFSEDLQKEMAKQLIPEAAAAVNQNVLRDLITMAGERFQKWERILTVRKMLGGYVMPLDLGIADYPGKAKEFVDSLYFIEASWDTIERDGVRVKDLYPFTFATENAIDIMTHDARTRVQALTYRQFHPVVENYLIPARNQYEYLMI